MNPGDHEAWYQTARGSWIAGHEFNLMGRLLGPSEGATLLDVVAARVISAAALPPPVCGSPGSIRTRRCWTMLAVSAAK